jgi:hypothetical protein
MRELAPKNPKNIQIYLYPIKAYSSTKEVVLIISKVYVEEWLKCKYIMAKVERCWSEECPGQQQGPYDVHCIVTKTFPKCIILAD